MRMSCSRIHSGGVSTTRLEMIIHVKRQFNSEQQGNPFEGAGGFGINIEDLMRHMGGQAGGRKFFTFNFGGGQGMNFQF
jgi:hypothetical protein